MTREKSRVSRWGITFLALVGVVAGVAVIVGVVSGGQAQARELAEADGAGPLPARSNISALVSPDTAMSSLPSVAQNLPSDVAPEPGSVRKLMAGEGESDVSIYAWPKGEGERVCAQTSFGSGGCFAKFLKGEFFNVTESDPDRVGHGTPLLFWGVVPDQVVGVTVIALGKQYEATVKNNAVLFEMPDSSLGYSSIASFIVQLSDGSSQVIKN